jgi:hypothetical protein
MITQITPTASIRWNNTVMPPVLEQMFDTSSGVAWHAVPKLADQNPKSEQHARRAAAEAKHDIDILLRELAYLIGFWSAGDSINKPVVRMRAVVLAVVSDIALLAENLK